MTEPRQRPIIMSGESVRATIAGTKTQTRRVIHLRGFGPSSTPGYDWCFRDRRARWNDVSTERLLDHWCPFQIGQRLWVKEAFRLRLDQDDVPPSQDWWRARPWYEADRTEEPSGCGGGMGKLRSPLFMPRWASRLLLEVTEVRAERVQDISEEDARADRLNAKRGYPWEAHPYVWAVSYRVVEQAREQEVTRG